MSRKIEIYDPALCCPTGICGPNVDPELTRISRTVTILVNQGHDVSRYNLAQEPEPFSKQPDVQNLLTEEGPESLPATVVNGELVKSKTYPTKAEFAEWLGIKEEDIEVRVPKNTINLSTE
ncbi:arsenite efflux transporter metallochaperone ArsD [Texcoconibacillus texcoconensis]|uniref:Sulfur carrier protein ThiS n=1 Tax=Texcoconibacillus texcoconensis TaxID=1095777 RepID=A0A840QTH0_9BACI|nr:arsenite efflux transporter metallochaperone ArsD [Texcoconibacillus texcoconensis]MBB5174664.1 sulfur carrier protein ThiS [Texcoconibacillus texcoconensis]